MVDQVERQRMIRELRFLYRGRFNEEEAVKIFDHVQWDRQKGFNFILENDPVAVRTITGQSEDVIVNLKADPSITDSLLNGITKSTRQFACESCDHAWWRKVPVRKEVSQCKKCKKKYDPVPREEEWGWATYNCECGNEFSGSGQRKTSAPCYQCDESVYPTDIKPFWRRRDRKSNNRHCCDAPDCTGHEPVPIHDVDPNRVYDDGTYNGPNVGPSRNADVDNMANNVDNISGRVETIYLRDKKNPKKKKEVSTCVSPESRANKKKVIYPSEPHISTGSTVGTFLSQGDVASTFKPSLPSIPEYRGFGRPGGRGSPT